MTKGQFFKLVKEMCDDAVAMTGGGDPAVAAERARLYKAIRSALLRHMITLPAQIHECRLDKAFKKYKAAEELPEWMKMKIREPELSDHDAKAMVGCDDDDDDQPREWDDVEATTPPFI